MLVWSGSLIGSSEPQVAKLALFREGRHTIAIDMTAVDRIDFVCAGSLLNLISRTESQHKTVQIIGASPIIRALLMLIGRRHSRRYRLVLANARGVEHGAPRDLSFEARRAMPVESGLTPDT
jgi:anti-anti-sigma regulatory factor